MPDDWITEKNGEAVIRVRVKPRASRDRIEGPTPDGCLAVRLTAPPVDNAANLALIALLAKKLGVPKSAITITAGEKSKTKTLQVQGLGKPAAIKSLV
jgi:uncharacterized protein